MNKQIEELNRICDEIIKCDHETYCACGDATLCSGLARQIKELLQSPQGGEER